MKQTFYSSFALCKRTIIFLFVVIFLCGVTANAQTYTINFTDPTPSVGDPLADQNDGILNAIETGVRFKVSQPGTITEIRFFKGTGVAGTHIGHLWTNAGTQLASATFSESASGWQPVGVSVHIAANTLYVASVFSSLGDYASELFGSFNWFTSGTPGVDFGSNPIRVPHTLNSATDPAGNGLYIYLANPTTGAFPTSVNSNNFWIDVRFVPDFSLPVSLSDFKASTASNDVVLNWKTDHEFSNRGFEIQRSNNGADWYAVNFVNSAGDGTTARNYNYTDKGLAPGTYYYRLKQSDIDGKNTFSAIVTATVSGKGKVSLLQNYPNPFSGSTNIRFDLPETQHARLSVVDLSGREVKVLSDKLSEAGSHVITLDASNLRPQVYLVTLRTANGIFTKKISVK